MLNMMPYHPNNLPLQQYPHWRVKVLAWIAKALDVQFDINGIPFGAEVRKKADWELALERSGTGA